MLLGFHRRRSSAGTGLPQLSGVGGSGPTLGTAVEIDSLSCSAPSRPSAWKARKKLDRRPRSGVP